MRARTAWAMLVARKMDGPEKRSPCSKWRVHAILPVILVAHVAQPAFAASSKDEWWDEACSEKSASRWCAPRLREGGWKLKYRSRNPEDLTDVFWLIEVWVRGSDALVCEYKGGRGGVRSNGCYTAVEVK